MVICVVVIILEKIEYFEDVLVLCMLYLEELYSMLGV